MSEHDRPWVTGPSEILQHGVGLLATDTDANRRLAMIAIDNAVELLIKPFLGLPKRITGLTISKKEYQDIAQSFPALLDALEQHAARMLKGVDLAEIEWYHRLRNQLYHQGNGLTVERKKVEIYAELAKILFSNLFGTTRSTETPSPFGVLPQLLTAWYALERGVIAAASEDLEPGRPVSNLPEAIRQLKNAGRLSVNDVHDLHELRKLRNLVAHGEPRWEQQITKDVIDQVWSFANRFPWSPTPKRM